ncbi:anchored repeat-type ABC transporter ATP-binding subunit [Microbacterium sp. SORGH_AS_0888]|uniref:anchored repeat-type ABC transporter ATP-binding subunit n=1 Tax=Microbacterium sp. SORGH_AS_0888 TaxID=3041791 RepID=UPI002789F635|nr:anchored repeat-type ABC transporter ATP-binding subunit [Microbacterium sp. SORGH_AS_0888]MDQ1128252.1 manganese/iron transport system ATP-binding protein [Microbacterium sp. SORGH_AS_0888]
MSAAPAVEIVDLAVDLGGRRVLEHADLVVTAGELTGLVGPNGAGKTTLLRAVLGLLRPAAGTVRVAGRSTRPGRAPIGYVPQRHDFAFDFPLSVAHVVVTGMTGALGLLRRPRAADWERVAEALDRVRMGAFADRPVGQLSGGQRQRVLVARALVSQPAVLLLDEPFTGLDVPTQELLTELFRDLAHEGRAVLMTTHDLVGAVDGCDRIAMLNRTVIAVGEPSQLAADAALWMRAFGVGPESALLRAVAAAAR